jgi:protein arginine N-methyltransferase 3
LEAALDFFGMIKFVNYVRSQVKDGNAKPEIENPASWDDEKFMQPVLEDDALLFSVDELESMEAGDASSGKQPEASNESNNATDEVAQLKEQLSKLQSKFDVYREQVSETLEKRWSDAPSKDDGAAEAKAKRYDDSYFDSYSFNDIHQVMLQDTVRTEAYRDFIYENKHLFAGKTVMDVGCGTGILSMFCAKAGAKQVFAMDNSAIIDKARQIAIENGLDKQITFVRGKVEDLHELPGGYKHVDIIVSEWMGYCLFFENMLPSVFCMRDRFMKRRADGSFDGLMVPSHVSVHLAPLADPDWVSDNVTFWNDVYGFDMHCMLEGALDDVVVQHPPAKTVVGATAQKQPVAIWDLHQATAEDLQFEVPFEVKLDQDIDSMDAWCTWFDTVFSPAPAAEAGAPGRIEPAEQEKLSAQKGAVTFSTSPMTKRTHWQCGTCIIDRKGKAGGKLSAGTAIGGMVKFLKDEEGRGLNITAQWEAKEAEEKGNQSWKMR